FSRDWSSDVCSSDLILQERTERCRHELGSLPMQARRLNLNKAHHIIGTQLRQFRWPVAEAIFEEAADERKIVDLRRLGQRAIFKIGRASCRQRGLRY